MAAAGDFQALCDEATCPICLEYFSDPVSIAECGHNFCQGCLTQSWGEKEGDGLVVSCPQCRETTQRKKLVPNWALKNVLEIVKKLSPEGQVKDREVDGVCQKHQEPLKLYCKDHQAPICLVCDRSKEHENHKVVPQEEAFQEYKDQICSRLEILRAERKKILMNKVDSEKESQDLLNQTEEKRQKTKAEFQQIHQFLEEQEKSRLAQIEEVEKEVARRRDEHLARLCRELSSLENLIEVMEEKSQQPASEFLQDIGKTLQRYEKKEETFENPVAFPPVAFPPELTCRIKGFYDVKPLLEDVVKQFQDCWPLLGTGEEPARLPPFGLLGTAVKKIRLFPSLPLCVALMSLLILLLSPLLFPPPTAKVTLDPDTAHPQLILSEDLKSVRWEDKMQDLPNNPERFNIRSFVLGSEGFTAGRHFWVVTVGREGDWAMGVARMSVRRKGWFDLSPEEGIWAVGNFGDGRVLSSSDSTRLSLRQELKRIRVTLNCAEGQVSFSDADSGVHIYTFSGVSFSGETLLPFFWVEDEGHLRLSP